jgi:SM-20-related protein
VRPALADHSPATLSAVRSRLAATGRAQLHDLLTGAYAEHLRAEADLPEFNVVTRRSTGHVDLPAAWLHSLEPHQRQALGQAVQAAATDEFQYLFDNYPIYDMAASKTVEPVWAELIGFLNGEAFLGLMRQVTGEPRIALADAQLTRFRRGHFLTAHDDTAEGKQRYYAYVLSLTPGWRIDWGGLLAFHDDEGNVGEAFTPRFNTLNLLKVPAPHSVTQVALSAGADRVSITGWLRGAD